MRVRFLPALAAFVCATASADEIDAALDGRLLAYDYAKIEDTWRKHSWHRVTFFGDFRSDVEAFAAKIGYAVDYES